MKISDRIQLIKEISRRLAPEEWELIDLTLKQFGFPIQDQWSGNKEGYIIEMVSDGTNNELIEIADHLGYKKTFPGAKEAKFWYPDYFRLFLSHISAYKDKTALLSKELNKYAISSFVAHEDIEPTKEWQNEIELALNTMDALVALLTEGFNNSKWTDQEVGIALGRGILVVPIRLGVDPYGFIGKNQGMQGAGKKIEAVAKKIFEILSANELTGHRITAAVTSKFLSSYSYQDAKDNISLLESCKYFSNAILSELQNKYSNNSQIRDSFGVPARLKRLISEQQGN